MEPFLAISSSTFKSKPGSLRLCSAQMDSPLWVAI